MDLMASGFKGWIMAIHDFNAVDQDFFLRNKTFVVFDNMPGNDEIQGF